MLRFTVGNLFDSDAAALVNTVNCAGIMGKGIAYQFRRAYPAMHKAYVADCKAGAVQLGEVRGYHEHGRLIINFPTKQHWRSKSRIEDVAAGLKSLRSYIVANGVASVAVPPLGCGNGGLSWDDVKHLIEVELGDVDGVDIVVYEPVGHFDSTVAKAPKLSVSHYVLAALRVGLTNPNKLNLQKAVYFFNVMYGQPFFRFDQHRYGPFSIAIDPMILTIKDFLDFTGLSAKELIGDALGRHLSGRDVERLNAMYPAVKATIEYCNRRIDQLEALSTAHAVVSANPGRPIEEITRYFLAWSEEKALRFGEADVARAVEMLVHDRLIRRTISGFEAANQGPTSKQAVLAARTVDVG
ncbi:MAG: macro domain-containing protein [Deltaproteobacteria bacterium]|nr:macro domain-containing protein [Deltaproteobacteria bacterium]